MNLPSLHDFNARSDMMRTRLKFCFVGPLPFVLYGCGGGSGGVGSPLGGSALTRGTEQLNQVASGQQSATPTNLKSIFDLFNEALNAEPNTSKAHFGAAIALMGLLGQEADGTATGIIPGGSGIGGGTGAGGGNTGIVLPAEVPPSPPGYDTPINVVPPHRTLGLFWNLDRGLANPLTLLNMLSPITDMRGGLLPFNGYFGDDATGREQMLAKLDQVIAHLKAVEADAQFTFTLASPDQNGKEVTVGLPEVHLFHSYVESLRVETALSLAYIRSIGELPPPIPPVISNDSQFLPRNQDTNRDGKLSPNEYLPSSPFLTLRDAKYLQIAKQAILNCADAAEKGIAGVLARPVGETAFLIPNNAEMNRNLTEQRETVLPVLRQVTTQPVTLEVPRVQPLPMLMNAASGSGRPSDDLLFTTTLLPPIPPNGEPAIEPVVLNLAAWFSNPPADLKVFAPTYSLDSNGWPHYDQASYPDLTFAGLFPNGLPAFLR
jgi:hypothetical protein